MTPELIAAIHDYHPSDQTLQRLRQVKTVIFTGITAAGKNTIMAHLIDSGGFSEIITSTTRAPRENNGQMEQNGREYYFIDFEKAAQLIENKGYVEVKQVHDNVYGTLASEYQRVYDEGTVAIADIDVQGADEFLGFDARELYVLFVVPPSFDVWFERLKGRYGGSLEGRREDIIARFRSAQKEIAHALKNPAFIPVMNIDSAQTAAEVRRIIFEYKLPSPAAREHAEACLHQLQNGLENYIAAMQD